jgi:hypothetical protein
MKQVCQRFGETYGPATFSTPSPTRAFRIFSKCFVKNFKNLQFCMCICVQDAALWVTEAIISVLHGTKCTAQSLVDVVRRCMRFRCFKTEVSRLQIQSVLKYWFIYRTNFGDSANQQRLHAHTQRECSRQLVAQLENSTACDKKHTFPS